MRQKIDIKMKNGRYKVVGLSNRKEPYVGSVIEEKQLDELILEAKRNGELTVNIK